MITTHEPALAGVLEAIRDDATDVSAWAALADWLEETSQSERVCARCLGHLWEAYTERCVCLPRDGDRQTMWYAGPGISNARRMPVYLARAVPEKGYSGRWIWYLDGFTTDGRAVYALLACLLKYLKRNRYHSQKAARADLYRAAHLWACSLVGGGK